MKTKSKLLVGILLTLFSVVAMISSVMLYLKAWPSISLINEHQDIQPLAESNCTQAASKFGFTAKQLESGSITMTKSIISDHTIDFGKASALIVSCQGYALERFCAGAGCGANQIQFSLKPAIREEGSTPESKTESKQG